ncbi:hypothetical protein COW77_00590 [Candidatus Wolfebacteria bacterium CG18_big_fil_WC_8_21_14_2_50_39_7]|uniref:Uncharacterized protein n=5 Tax=Candidatus Wolfeibacteriota TaxID=1752735 RepID=A0A2M7Q7K1_9BACT|nr:hypothetical protein [Parcubacteria group bacterium]NCO89521.1 hypothetical protein [Candidatus Wolfebacteria bacterium]OIO65363.1 MAG: hypothetical protein AUJ30_01130 [Candidatus Wolfebacteria bacterium CG1_02_39_135]PIP92308.1 MAG: hypothetical protein COW77_00590 [Candidatus Wolfebacteria bacterium CG18_big_fil_WC_8_21_14_2_50_39_7]PIU98829.1 MAG: hypothetical protein COS60_00945 [Candidatus Wolfebacteria bacterium CG03_land_8_20_14_0_80_39_317]PIY59092.1 MAG: hypothetical protein COY97
MITLERWQNLPKRDQLGHIASEIKRALSMENDKDIFIQIIERAFYLIDLSLNDPKWRGNPLPLLVLRDGLAKIYIGEEQNLEKIYAAL